MPASTCEARVGQVDDADVRLDGRERVVRRQHLVLGQGVEQGGLADVGQSDDRDSESHGQPSYRRAARGAPRAGDPAVSEARETMVRCPSTSPRSTSRPRTRAARPPAPSASSRCATAVVVDKVGWLIKPAGRARRRSSSGTPASTASAPTTSRRLRAGTSSSTSSPTSRAIDVFVAHNAGFDMGVIKGACAATGSTPPPWRLPLQPAGRPQDLRARLVPPAARRGGRRLRRLLAPRRPRRRRGVRGDRRARRAGPRRRRPAAARRHGPRRHEAAHARGARRRARAAPPRRRAAASSSARRRGSARARRAARCRCGAADTPA